MSNGGRTQTHERKFELMLVNNQTRAKSLGQSENDVAGFLAGLSVWVKKGYSIEVAIANNAVQLSRVLSKDTTFVNSVHAALQ